jgi:hypothetical protein
MKNLTALLTSALLTTSLFGQSYTPGSHPFHRPLVFEPNRGQAPDQVKWIARASGYLLFITSDGVTMMLPDGQTTPLKQALTPIRFQLPESSGTCSDRALSTVRMKLTGSHPWNTGKGLEPTGGVSNYLLGSDRKAWRTDIPHYSRLSIPAVYDGIDLVFYSDGDKLEYDFVVAPGADSTKIQLAFEGTDRLRVEKTGDLVMIAGNSEIRHVRPHIYQQVGDRKIEVAGGYNLLDRAQATFTLASYDHRQALIIDPTVSFTDFLAGSSEDTATGIAVDNAGNSYVTGDTLSSNFPIANAFEPGKPGGLDAFVAKLSPTGAIIFSTYFGGIATDTASGIAVDSTGIYITGSTLSSDFPGSRNLPVNSASDMYVTKLSPAGNTFIYSHAIGGTSYDAGLSIALDSSHAAYVTGYTYSPDFPTVGGWHDFYNGNVDAFVMKLSPSGTITNSLFLGGSSTEIGYGIAVDGLSHPWITGETCSDNFPHTMPIELIVGCNVFVTRLNSTLNGFAFSTQFGGGNSWGQAIAVDAGFFGYITGTTYSNFPTTPGAFQTSKPGTQGSAFVVKMDSLGGTWYSTYLGASDGYTTGLAVTPGRGGEVYVSGATSSSAFPGAPVLKPNPTAGFVTRLWPTLSGVQYTTLLGATINGIALFYPSPSVLVQPQIYTAGHRYTGGLNYTNLDAFVVKLIQ